jgi:hypothetical protein
LLVCEMEIDVGYEKAMLGILRLVRTRSAFIGDERGIET